LVKSKVKIISVRYFLEIKLNFLRKNESFGEKMKILWKIGILGENVIYGTK